MADEKETGAPAPKEGGDADRFGYDPGDLVVEAPKDGKRLIPDDDAPAEGAKE